MGLEGVVVVGVLLEGTCFAAAFAPNFEAIEGPNLDAVLSAGVVLSDAAGLGIEAVVCGATLSLLLLLFASLSLLLLRSTARSLSVLLSRGRCDSRSCLSRSRYLSRDSLSSDAGALVFHFSPFEIPGSRLLGRRGLRERSRLDVGAMMLYLCSSVWDRHYTGAKMSCNEL